MENIIRQLGQTVLIKQNLIGVILSSYKIGTEEIQMRIYRVLINANDCCYRVISNNIDQRDDKMLFQEDIDTLLCETENVAVVEVSESDLTDFENIHNQSF